MFHKLLLRLVDSEYAIIRFNVGTALPEWLSGPGFWAVINSREEMTLVCRAARIPDYVKASGGWRCFRIEEPHAIDVVGMLASVLDPLAKAGVSVFANSTFSTDYIFLSGSYLDKALDALKAAGHEILY